MVSTIVSLFHKIFEKTDKRWIRQSKPKSMKMVSCIFKKKVNQVNYALSGSVFQTICGKFGNSNCTAVGLLYSTSHSSAAAALKPTVCCRFILFSFANKKLLFFNFTDKNEVEQNELRFRRTSQAAILAQLPSRQTFFSEAGFTLGRRLSCIERRKSHLHQRASITPSVIFFFESF